MKRAFDPNEPELMDRPQPVTPELERDLANLVSLNRNFGGHRIVRRFLSQWLNPGRCYRLLDLCTGAGDIPRLMLDWARPRETVLRIDAVDANPSTLEIARSHSAAYPEIDYIRGDALKYDSSASYDLVVCSLALHHFGEDDAIALLRRCRQLSHRYVLVTDLERSALTSLSVWLVTALLYPEPMTRFDGRLSARRAFSYREMRALAEAADWPAFAHARFLPCRQALWLDTRNLADIPASVIPESMPSPA